MKKKKKSTQAATFHIPVTEPSPSSDTRREPQHRATSAPSSPLDRGSAREEKAMARIINWIQLVGKLCCHRILKDFKNMLLDSLIRVSIN